MQTRSASTALRLRVDVRRSAVATTEIGVYVQVVCDREVVAGD